MNLQKMSNGQLYREWTDAMELSALGGDDGYAKRREEQCLDEIIRRMQEASRRPLVRQEASCG